LGYMIQNESKHVQTTGMSPSIIDVEKNN